MNYERAKRIFDLVTAALALALFFFPLALLALLVAWRLGRPVFFVQTRTGRAGRSFALIKFRTMTDARDSVGNLLPDSQRLTYFGRFLRASSLDELPELWNILRGEMSWVGPRPLLPEYLSHYSTEQARRLEVLPGITGWAQVNGRNRTTWEERFRLDVWYVDHRSFRLDLKILFLTLLTVLRVNQVNTSGGDTMPLFRGSNV